MKKETVYTSIQIDESYWGTLTSKVGRLFSGAKAGNKTGQQTQQTGAGNAGQAQQQTQTDVGNTEQPVSDLQQTIKSSTSDILLPQAILIKSLLTKQIGQSLAKVLGGLSQEQRKTIMTPVMQYLNTLPNIASQVIAEQATPTATPKDKTQQDLLKNKLATKHAGNVKLINKNLTALQTQIFNDIKSKLNANSAANMLYNSIDKKYGDTKQGLKYITSLQKNPQAHLDALLAALQVVLDNIMLIIQSSMPKQEAPKANLPENKTISESQINRWKVLAEIKK